MPTGTYERPTRTFTCQNCGKEAYTSATHNQNKWCYHCRVAINQRQKRERRNASRQVYLTNCPVCAKQFPQEHNKVYCSNRCNKRAWKVRNREWVLQDSKIYQNKKKFSGNYLRALERDDGKCVKCGNAAETVHHLDNRGDKCTIVTKNHELSNLMSLCWPCHREEHILDWAFDGKVLIVKCKAFERLLGRDTIEIARKEVLI